MEIIGQFLIDLWQIWTFLIATPYQQRRFVTCLTRQGFYPWWSISIFHLNKLASWVELNTYNTYAYGLILEIKLCVSLHDWLKISSTIRNSGKLSKSQGMRGDNNKKNQHHLRIHQHIAQLQQQPITTTTALCFTFLQMKCWWRRRWSRWASKCVHACWLLALLFVRVYMCVARVTTSIVADFSCYYVTHTYVHQSLYRLISPHIPRNFDC